MFGVISLWRKGNKNKTSDGSTSDVLAGTILSIFYILYTKTPLKTNSLVD
ncbi:MAG: hypothetical protein ACK4NY_15625 [Spirosomataceae bacterium]